MTPKQEAFCQAYIETGNASEAYRRAYPKSRQWKPETLWPHASKLLKNDKVATRLAELREKTVEKHEVTVASIAAKLELAYKAAAKFGQSGGMVQAQMGIAKLYGLITDKQSVTVHDKRESADWSRSELVALLDDTKARGNGAAAPNGRGREPDQLH